MLRIGEVARGAGVGVTAVRYYEREGILPEAERTTSGYRMFPDEAVGVIRFVKRAQELGFSLDDIRALLALRSSRRSRCASVQRVAEEKLADVEQRIDDLERMRRALGTLLRACKRDGGTLRCPILESLQERD